MKTEEFLLKNGYKKCVFKKGSFYESPKGYYSTMGDISFWFIKKGETQYPEEIGIGLLLKGHSPFVFFPDKKNKMCDDIEKFANESLRLELEMDTHDFLIMLKEGRWTDKE